MSSALRRTTLLSSEDTRVRYNPPTRRMAGVSKTYFYGQEVCYTDPKTGKQYHAMIVDSDAAGNASIHKTGGGWKKMTVRLSDIAPWDPPPKQEEDWYENPYYRPTPGGLPHIPATHSDKCYLIFNDDGTIAKGPTGERFCFSEAKAKEIVEKISKAKKEVAADDAAASKTPRVPKAISDDKSEVVPCKDGKLSLNANGDIMFVARNGQHHGILLYGRRDPDYDFVRALGLYIRNLHRDGSLRGMNGVTVLGMTPPGFSGPRGPYAAAKPYYG